MCGFQRCHRMHTSCTCDQHGPDRRSTYVLAVLFVSRSNVVCQCLLILGYACLCSPTVADACPCLPMLPHVLHMHAYACPCLPTHSYASRRLQGLLSGCIFVAGLKRRLLWRLCVLQGFWTIYSPAPASCIQGLEMRVLRRYRSRDN